MLSSRNLTKLAADKKLDPAIGRSAIERVMQEFLRAAKRTTHLTWVILALARPPLLRGPSSAHFGNVPDTLRGRFGRLTRGKSGSWF